MPNCSVCEVEFTLPGGRGRPPKKCEACRGTGTVAVKLTSTEIVDRLEESLRLRGTHISQHQERW